MLEFKKTFFDVPEPLYYVLKKPCYAINTVISLIKFKTDFFIWF